MTPGEKWTRRFRMAPGKNTIRIVGSDLNHLCIQYIRKGGVLELIPKGSFNRQFYKVEEGGYLINDGNDNFIPCDTKEEVQALLKEMSDE